MTVFKPCPFCGSQPKIHTSWYTQHQKNCYGLTCCIINLGDSTRDFWTLESLAELWNTRAKIKTEGGRIAPIRQMDFNKESEFCSPPPGFDRANVRLRRTV